MLFHDVLIPSTNVFILFHLQLHGQKVLGIGGVGKSQSA